MNYIARIIFFSIFFYGCTKSSMQPQVNENKVPNNKQIYALSDDRCLAFAQNLFDGKKRVTDEKDPEAIMMQFTWYDSASDLSEQKLNCYFKNNE